MPIISCKTIENKISRISITSGNGMIENIVVSPDGLYSLYYIKNGINHNHTGRIINIVQNHAIPKNSYILFDWSEDNSNKRERIYFYQIQYIKDITPNNAYQIALKHGFVGTVDEWLESMKGLPGKDAYEIAVDCGFVGSREDFIKSMVGKNGLSAYDIAVQNGFVGSEKEWLSTLKGETGLSAYELAVQQGYNGTLDEWLSYNGNTQVAEIKNDIDTIKSHISWSTEME